MSSLKISGAEFRRLADEVVEYCVELIDSLDERRAWPVGTTGASVLSDFAQPCPEQGMGAAALEDLRKVVARSRPSSSRFFGYVFGSGENVAGVGDLMASVLNQNVTAWRSGPAAVTIERTVVRWLAEAVGCGGDATLSLREKGGAPQVGFGGSLCGGGSSANLMALAMAREAKAPANQKGAQPGLIYASTEVHMSIQKAAALLGLGHESVRLIPVNDHFRMNTVALAKAMEQDRRAGKKAIAVVANGGTVNTGAVDPLADIARIAREHGAWFHVDGAYGALAAIAVPELFVGLNEADSISLDPHKWLYQPADCGCLLYKDPGWARVAFSHSGDYARPLSEDPVEGFAFFEESMELSRRFRGLKLWLSLRYHGLAAFREAIRRDLEHARLLRKLIEKEPRLELLAAGELSAVCFRYRQERASEEELNRLNAEILRRVDYERGRVYISNASIGGKFALRACFVNHRATEADVAAIMEEVLAVAEEVGKPQGN
jgi:aromatic-L-amino-acid/L-tryptophan decarboxylase